MEKFQQLNLIRVENVSFRTDDMGRSQRRYSTNKRRRHTEFTELRFHRMRCRIIWSEIDGAYRIASRR